MKKLQFLKAGDYMKTITRAKYLDRIIELNGTPDIKIITGIQMCIRDRYYIDEFHLLLKEEQTATYSVEIWKRFRK